MNTTFWLRAGFGVLAAYQVILGIWALVFPSSYFADFPAGLGWVAVLPPYNEHLTRNVGGLSLGFAVVLAVAVVRPHSDLVTVSLVSWLTVAVTHLVFHVTTLRGSTPATRLRRRAASRFSWSFRSFCSRSSGAADLKEKQDPVSGRTPTTTETQG
jgi:hypothetical protein